MRPRCSIRKVSDSELTTPLVIPAFSSCNGGFKPAHCKDLRSNLCSVVCFSAYDLYHGYVGTDDVTESNFLFLDSGGYEMRCGAGPTSGWTPDLHEATIKELNRTNRIVLVSFDPLDASSLEAQLVMGERLKSSFPTVPVEIAIHPVQGGARELAGSAGSLAKFAVIGIPEEDLGESVLERCVNIGRLREALQSSGFDTPIHVLGCLEPTKVVAYFLCGADVFDGLSWQRQAFVGGASVTMGAATMATGEWRARDREIAFAWAARNLTYLDTLRIGLERICAGGSLGEVEGMENHVARIRSLLVEAGVEA